MSILKNYVEWTRSTVAYQPSVEGDYLTAGLVGEVGEFYSALAKFHRGDIDHQECMKRARKELGDVMWFIARLSDYYQWDIEELLQENMDKLNDRKARGVIKGDGDER